MFVEGLASSGDNMLRLFSEFNHNTWLGHETTVDIEDISFILIIQYWSTSSQLFIYNQYLKSFYLVAVA